MRTFRYKGISPDGVKINGVIKSYDEFEAVAKLREASNIVTKIEEVAETDGKGRPFRRVRLKEKELAILCSQFSIILASGMPVVRCVEMVAAQAKNKSLRRMLEKVAEDIDGGYSMARSFEKNGGGLPTTFVETIRAGEESGSLEICFKRLHQYYDKSAKRKAKLISALTYPAIVMVVAVIVFIVIIAVAVPAFIGVFEDLNTELPGITKAMIAFSNFLTGYWWVLLGLAAALVVAYLAFRRTEQGKRTLSAFRLNRAPLHKLIAMNQSAQFANTLSTMLAAGLPVGRLRRDPASVSDVCAERHNAGHDRASAEIQSAL